MDLIPLDLGLDATTGPGRAAAGAAASHVEPLAARAEGWDRDGRFPVDVIGELRTSGLAAAAVPEDLGGGGVLSLLDLMAVVATVAEGDGSVAIALAMHLGTTWGTARAGRAPDLMRAVAAGEVWFGAAITEAGTNFFHPRSEVSVEDSGRRVLRGRKVLSTGSPVATHLASHAAMRGGEHDGRIVSFLLPADLPGIRRDDDWDGLGMRASASSTVVFEDVELGEEILVAPGGRIGEFTPAALCGRAFGNVTNLAAMHGIAAGAVGVARVACDRRATSRQALGEAVAQVASSAAVLRDLGRRADAVATGEPLDLAGAHRFMATFQAAKLAAHRATVAAVDLAMQVTGGRSYSAGHPLARAYRDVRAGPFMEPFRPHEALGYLGALGAGTDPDVTA